MFQQDTEIAFPISPFSHGEKTQKNWQYNLIVHNHTHCGGIDLSLENFHVIWPAPINQMRWNIRINFSSSGGADGSHGYSMEQIVLSRCAVPRSSTVLGVGGQAKYRGDGDTSPRHVRCLVLELAIG